jgi:hypothetical protein
MVFHPQFCILVSRVFFKAFKSQKAPKKISLLQKVEKLKKFFGCKSQMPTMEHKEEAKIE